MCMRVEFHHTKNGFPSAWALSMKASASAVTSSSTVSMRFRVSGPVSSIVCVPSALADDRITPRGPNCSLNAGSLRVVGVLRLLLGVEVVEVAEELLEAVVGRQHLVAVAEVVLAELAGDVAERAQQPGDGRVLDLHALGRAGQADLGQPGADRRLAGDEGGAPGGAALLAVPVGEERALLGDPVDVGRAVAHHAVVVGADVELADVVAPDHQDVGLRGAALLRRRRRGQGKAQRGEGGEQRRTLVHDFPQEPSEADSQLQGG